MKDSFQFLEKRNGKIQNRMLYEEELESLSMIPAEKIDRGSEFKTKTRKKSRSRRSKSKSKYNSSGKKSLKNIGRSMKENLAQVILSKKDSDIYKPFSSRKKSYQILTQNSIKGFQDILEAEYESINYPSFIGQAMGLKSSAKKIDNFDLVNFDGDVRPRKGSKSKKRCSSKRKSSKSKERLRKNPKFDDRTSKNDISKFFKNLNSTGKLTKIIAKQKSARVKTETDVMLDKFDQKIE